MFYSTKWLSNTQKCTLISLMPFLAHPCAPHDVISIKTIPSSGMDHPHLHSVQFEINQTDGSWVTAIFVSYPPVFPDLTIIWPLETWLQNQHHCNWSLSLPRPQQTPLVVHWPLEPHPSACPYMTGTQKMHTTLSLYFSVPWRTGSSLTVSCLTARTTSDMFLQPWEPNP